MRTFCQSEWKTSLFGWLVYEMVVGLRSRGSEAVGKIVVGEKKKNLSLGGRRYIYSKILGQAEARPKVSRDEAII